VLQHLLGFVKTSSIGEIARRVWQKLDTSKEQESWEALHPAVRMAQSTREREDIPGMQGEIST
jgi:hypothetical protein